MKNVIQVNGAVDKKSHNIYVLEHHTPDDVAKAMIEGGDQKQPFYIFNMDEAYRRVQHFTELLPRVKIFYAMKSNDTELMLKLAIALGLGFDCASPGEIYKLRQLNVNPRSIIYAMPCKTPGEMMYARKTGIRHTTFDSSYQLKQLKQFWPDAKLLIRIRIDGKSKKKLGQKFGCDFETEAKDLLDEAAALGLEVAGVAFHVGSICYSPRESFKTGIRQARVLFDHEASAGRCMNILDIGGGLISDRTNRVDEVSDVINSNLEELFPDHNVQVIAEPGRYVSDSAYTLYCNIIGVRRVIRNNVPVNMIYLKDGIYGTMMFAEDWHKLNKFKRSSSQEESVLNEETILWGPSCDSVDRVMEEYKIELPACTADDWLVVENHGAYTFTYSTKFSSLELPLIRTVVSKELWDYIKTSSVFEPSDFTVKPDISAPLMSTLPPVLPQKEIYEHNNIPTLRV